VRRMGADNLLDAMLLLVLRVSMRCAGYGKLRATLQNFQGNVILHE
jgi:hypothetical protein